METTGRGAVHAALDPARGRFLELDEQVQDAFRDLLTRFVNLYAFVSQIVSYVDWRLERDYPYARALLAWAADESHAARARNNDFQTSASSSTAPSSTRS